MGFQIARITALTALSLVSVVGTGCYTDESDDPEAMGTDAAGSGDTGGTTGAGDDSNPITTTLMTTGVTTIMPMDDDSTGGEASTGDGEDNATNVDTGMATTGGVEMDCGTYCGIYMDACSDFSQYANDQECMDHCGQWPVGTEQDVEGDTLGCRMYHVTVASGNEPSVHCPHASPSGDGVCAEEEAPDCQTYCETYLGNCTGDNGVYVDMDDCMTQCAPWYPGLVEDISRNTVGCRTYHGGAPAFGDPELHCPHAGPGGADVCVFE